MINTENTKIRIIFFPSISSKMIFFFYITVKLISALGIVESVKRCGRFHIWLCRHNCTSFFNSMINSLTQWSMINLTNWLTQNISPDCLFNKKLSCQMYSVILKRKGYFVCYLNFHQIIFEKVLHFVAYWF